MKEFYVHWFKGPVQVSSYKDTIEKDIDYHKRLYEGCENGGERKLLTFHYNEDEHPDDIAIDKFAAAMKAKMKKQREKGYSGWDDTRDCPTFLLHQLLQDNVSKGDYLDAGNFAMMLFNRGEQTL